MGRLASLGFHWMYRPALHSRRRRARGLQSRHRRATCAGCFRTGRSGRSRSSRSARRPRSTPRLTADQDELCLPPRHVRCAAPNTPPTRVMNLCEHDNRPVQMILDLDRLKAEAGRDGWWNPSRRDLWRFGGLLPLDINNPDDRRHVMSLRRGCTPCLHYAHPLAEKLGCRLEVKDEGKHYPASGATPRSRSRTGAWR